MQELFWGVGGKEKRCYTVGYWISGSERELAHAYGC